jgi:hypothetical protein
MMTAKRISFAGNARIIAAIKLLFIWVTYEIINKRLYSSYQKSFVWDFNKNLESINFSIFNWTFISGKTFLLKQFSIQKFY